VPKLLLLDISANMKRIINAIEVTSLHLTLDIVRFDDALGVLGVTITSISAMDYE